MTDPFDALFYPGSKHQRREPVAPAPQVPDDLAWDARPYRKTVRGEEIEFFALGALAKALGRELVTIRVWERRGYLPKATFRLPNKNGKGGRRLYTRAQIEAVIRIAGEHQILDTPRIDWTEHPSLGADIAQAWAELARTA